METQRRALLAHALLLAAVPSLARQHEHHHPPAGGDYAQAQLDMAERVADALARGGEPMAPAAWAAVRKLADESRLAEAAREAFRQLQERVLLTAAITAEARVSVKRSARRQVLVQGGWRLFLVRVLNPSIAPGRLAASSPNAVPVNGLHPPGGPQLNVKTTHGDIAVRWMDLDVLNEAPLSADLEALPEEFKVLRIYARDAGPRSARIALDIGLGTGDIGGRDRVSVDFNVLPARTVRLSVRDHDGGAVTASLLITDSQGRVLPSQTRRSPPDMFFQKKIYRADGQTVLLPPGEYQVQHGRGPEYLLQRSQRRVPGSGEAHWTFQLQRWIDPAAMGWYSGDHHIHAAGCAHYAQPEEGVGPEMMMPQVRGEGLSIGSVLTWAPGFEAQKKFFTGRDSSLSGSGSILHYDLEVSGFPSSHCGHLALLRMKSMDYPGAQRIDDWPSSNAPVLRWARTQGAVTGYAHAGVGLWANTTDLPNDAMPPFNGIGANDFIVTLPEGLVDFISTCNHPPAAEMNIWYHTMNVGLRCRIAGETDWPCFFEESIGMGRSYVQLDGPLNYDDWCAGLGRGRSYVSEGRAHLIGFAAQSGQTVVRVGGADLELAAPAPVRFSAQFAARLEEKPTPETEAIRNSAPMDKPYWHLERARIGDTRSVVVELVINGVPVESRAMAADGSIGEVAFEYTPQSSCWAALRINQAAHTNPVWITVAQKPIRIARSARWCRAAVDQCWSQKSLRLRATERAEEQALYDRARRFYERMIAESA